jgi:hypothetical protein
MYLLGWDRTLELALVHLAKCANLFAETVREHVNPRFRITEGAFIIEPCGWGGDYGVYTFSDEEKRCIFESGSVEYETESPWEAVRETWIDPPIQSST